MFSIGCHLSSSKGYLNMAKTIVSLGGNTFQFFTRNPQGGSRLKPLDLQDINAYNDFAREHEFGYVIAHAPYTMNLAGNESISEFGKRMLKEDLERIAYLSKVYYNFHPGSHVGIGSEEGIKKIINILNEVVTSNEGPMVLLETMAGKGSEIGRNFFEIKAILDGVNYKERFGVTLDTCHVFDAGYDIKNHLDDVLKEFDSIIGIKHLKAIHLNDSLNVLGSRKDRHAKIGEGNIGADSLIAVTNHPLLKDLPFVLETPNELDGYQKEITFLKENHI